MPAELIDAQAETKKWILDLKGLGEDDIKKRLGTDCKRSTWKSGDYGGLNLIYDLGSVGELTLMFQDGKVIYGQLQLGTN